MWFKSVYYRMESVCVCVSSGQHFNQGRQAGKFKKWFPPILQHFRCAHLVTLAVGLGAEPSQVTHSSLNLVLGTLPPSRAAEFKEAPRPPLSTGQ